MASSSGLESRPSASAVAPPAFAPQGLGAFWTSCVQLLLGAPSSVAPAFPVLAGQLQGPHAVWVHPRGADWGLQTQEAGGELFKLGLQGLKEGFVSASSPFRL